MTTSHRARHGSVDRPALLLLGASIGLTACGASRSPADDAGLDGRADADAGDCTPDFPPD